MDRFVKEPNEALLKEKQNYGNKRALNGTLETGKGETDELEDRSKEITQMQRKTRRWKRGQDKKYRKEASLSKSEPEGEKRGTGGGLAVGGK